MKRPRGRPPKDPAAREEALRRFEEHVNGARTDAAGAPILRSDEVKQIRDIPHGVSISWLCTVFRVDRRTAQLRLAKCPTMRVAGDRRVTLYDVATAAPYLVTPNLTSEEFLRVLNRTDLPNGLQVQFWDAMLKRQKWEENAGQLWPTGRVLDVLGQTFQTMKFAMQLWVETLEREAEVTPEQRAALTRMVDALQQEIYSGLVERAKEGQTGPLLADIPNLLGERPGQEERKSDGPAFDPDDDGSDLI